MEFEKLSKEDKRFCMELEFVQCLANPNYLYYLAQQRYFEDVAFVNYLKYLLYWKTQEYSKYIVYPQCLKFLDLLQKEEFRRRLHEAKFIEYISNQQFLHWKFRRNQEKKQHSIG